jgi:hypothetical protein
MRQCQHAELYNGDIEQAYELLYPVASKKFMDEFRGMPLEEILRNGSNQRDAKWTESIAVGDKEFVMETKSKLGAKAKGRSAMENSESYELRESQSSYNHIFTPEKCSLRLKNDRFWQIS